VFHVPVPGGEISIDCVYWAGTAVIALFVVGGCNAANLIDGLDGLLSGVVAVVAIGLLCISLMLAFHPPTWAVEDESLSGARIVLCLALLGAVLGFLPHNFNPASIFLGDGGSQLLGYVCVVIILMLGEWGQTHLVIAGLIVFAVPIMDTILAIVRRRLAGRPMSSADDQHVHHQLKRGLGGVKPAVFAMYGVSAAFAAVGVALAALVTLTRLRVRVVYAVVLVLFGFIAVIAVKAARKQAEKLPARRTVPASAAPPPPVASEPARRPTPANTP
jgi:UDP-GlcNAc:undecaprenyl-phosphate GlcNAc-1-phosphate transferase